MNKIIIIILATIFLLACNGEIKKKTLNANLQTTVEENLQTNPKYHNITATNFKEKILENVKHYPKEPIYYMRLGKANCVIEVLVNDYLVYRNYELSNEVTPIEIN